MKSFRALLVGIRDVLAYILSQSNNLEIEFVRRKELYMNFNFIQLHHLVSHLITCKSSLYFGTPLPNLPSRKCS